MIKVARSKIDDTNINVGSGCIWQGTGSEPQWDDPKSTKAYDRIERHHGPQLKPSQLQGRAGSKMQPQGQWYSREDWVKAEKLMPKHPGLYILEFEYPVGRVYYPDGRILEDTNYALVKRRNDGRLQCAYPIDLKRALLQDL